MITTMQTILVTIFVFVFKFVGQGTQVFSYAPHILTGWIVGLIMGDTATGLEVGAELTLMSLGVGGFGGSSVPDYFLGTVIGTVFGVTTGDGVTAAVTIGVPVAALGTELDVLAKMSGSFFIHRQMAESEKGNFDGMGKWVYGGLAFKSLLSAIPVTLAMALGGDAITNLINNMPELLSKGFNTVAGILPAVGFATLLKYMNLKSYGIYVVFGFICSAYLGLSTLATAGLACVFAFIEYQSLERMSKVSVAAGPSADAIASGDYDE